MFFSSFNKPEMYASALEAAKFGDFEVAHKKLAAGESLLAYDATGWSVLHWAASHGDITSLQALSKHAEFAEALELPSRARHASVPAGWKAQIPLSPYANHTPLQIAIMQFPKFTNDIPKSLNVISFFLQHDASLCSKGAYHLNAMHLTILSQDVSLLQLVLQHRAGTSDLALACEATDTYLRTPTALLQHPSVSGHMREAASLVDSAIENRNSPASMPLQQRLQAALLDASTATETEETPGQQLLQFQRAAYAEVCEIQQNPPINPVAGSAENKIGLIKNK